MTALRLTMKFLSFHQIVTVLNQTNILVKISIKLHDYSICNNRTIKLLNQTAGRIQTEVEIQRNLSKTSKLSTLV